MFNTSVFRQTLTGRSLDAFEARMDVLVRQRQGGVQALQDELDGLTASLTSQQRSLLGERVLEQLTNATSIAARTQEMLLMQAQSAHRNATVARYRTMAAANLAGSAVAALQAHSVWETNFKQSTARLLEAAETVVGAEAIFVQLSKDGHNATALGLLNDGNSPERLAYENSVAEAMKVRQEYLPVMLAGQKACRDAAKMLALSLESEGGAITAILSVGNDKEEFERISDAAADEGTARVINVAVGKGHVDAKLSGYAIPDEAEGPAFGEKVLGHLIDAASSDFKQGIIGALHPTPWDEEKKLKQGPGPDEASAELAEERASKSEAVDAELEAEQDADATNVAAAHVQELQEEADDPARSVEDELRTRDHLVEAQTEQLAIMRRARAERAIAADERQVFSSLRILQRRRESLMDAGTRALDVQARAMASFAAAAQYRARQPATTAAVAASATAMEQPTNTSNGTMPELQFENVPPGWGNSSNVSNTTSWARDSAILKKSRSPPETAALEQEALVEAIEALSAATNQTGLAQLALSKSRLAVVRDSREQLQASADLTRGKDDLALDNKITDSGQSQNSVVEDPVVSPFLDKEEIYAAQALGEKAERTEESLTTFFLGESSRASLAAQGTAARLASSRARALAWRVDDHGKAAATAAVGAATDPAVQSATASLSAKVQFMEAVNHVTKEKEAEAEVARLALEEARQKMAENTDRDMDGNDDEEGEDRTRLSPEMRRLAEDRAAIRIAKKHFVQIFRKPFSDDEVVNAIAGHR